MLRSLSLGKVLFAAIVALAGILVLALCDSLLREKHHTPMFGIRATELLAETDAAGAHPDSTQQAQTREGARLDPNLASAPVRRREEFAQYSIIGRAIDESGRPIVGARVEVIREEYDHYGKHEGEDITDDRGVFIVNSLVHEMHTVVVNHPRKNVCIPIALRKGVIPQRSNAEAAAALRERAAGASQDPSDPDFCELVATNASLLETAWIVGRVVIPSRGHWLPATVSLTSGAAGHGSVFGLPESVGGDFEIGPVPPGTYQLLVTIRMDPDYRESDDEYVRIERIPISVTAGERRDVGKIRPQPVRRRLFVVGCHEGDPAMVRSVALRDGSKTISSMVAPEESKEKAPVALWIQSVWSAKVDSAVVFCDGFLPVTQALKKVGGKGIEEVHIDAVQRGCPVKFTVHVPRTGESEFSPFELHLVSESPMSSAHRFDSKTQSWSQLTVTLPQGKYRARVSTAIGARTEAAFELTEGALLRELVLDAR